MLVTLPILLKIKNSRSLHVGFGSDRTMAHYLWPRVSVHFSWLCILVILIWFLIYSFLSGSADSHFLKDVSESPSIILLIITSNSVRALSTKKKGKWTQVHEKLNVHYSAEKWITGSQEKSIQLKYHHSKKFLLLIKICTLQVKMLNFPEYRFTNSYDKVYPKAYPALLYFIFAFCAKQP